MRQWSEDPIAELVPSRIGREFLWLCLIVWVLAWLAVMSIDEWVSKRVLSWRAKQKQPNPAARTGTFLHRSRG